METYVVTYVIDQGQLFFGAWLVNARSEAEAEGSVLAILREQYPGRPVHVRNAQTLSTAAQTINLYVGGIVVAGSDGEVVA